MLAPFNDSVAAHLFKKTEKIALALYLVTDHLPESEPIRTTLRLLANEMLRSSIQVTGTYLVSGSDERMVGHLYESITFLHIAGTAKLISASNVALLIDEIERLTKDITSYREASQQGTSLRRSFFVVENTQRDAVLYKGHKGQVDTKMSFTKKVTTAGTAAANDVATSAMQQNIQTATKTHRPIQDTRTEKIIAVIREKGQVTIKDVAAAAPGVSDKTIQRELQKLVTAGILKRSGERRWSTYSIA